MVTWDISDIEIILKLYVIVSDKMEIIPYFEF
jgi:hypothetical protein